MTNIIRLFEGNATEEELATDNSDRWNYGLGVFSEGLISCEVNEELNGAFELEMVYAIDGPMIEKIQLFRIIVSRPNPWESHQAFRIYYISEPFDGKVTIRAQHISYDLSGYVCEPIPIQSIVPSAPGSGELNIWVENVVSLVNKNLNYKEDENQQSISFPFTFYVHDGPYDHHMWKAVGWRSTDTPQSVRSLLDFVSSSDNEDNSFNDFGFFYEDEDDNGNPRKVAPIEIYYDNFSIHFMKNRGIRRDSFAIEYGTNMTDFSIEADISEVYTDIYPYYYDEIISNTETWGETTNTGLGLVTLADCGATSKFISTLADIPRTDGIGAPVSPGPRKIFPLDCTDALNEEGANDSDNTVFYTIDEAGYRHLNKDNWKQKFEKMVKNYISNTKIASPKTNMTVSFVDTSSIDGEEYRLVIGDTVTVKYSTIGLSAEAECVKTSYDALADRYISVELSNIKNDISNQFYSSRPRNKKLQQAIEKAQQAAQKAESSAQQASCSAQKSESSAQKAECSSQKAGSAIEQAESTYQDYVQYMHCLFAQTESKAQQASCSAQKAESHAQQAQCYASQADSSAQKAECSSQRSEASAQRSECAAQKGSP